LAITVFFVAVFVVLTMTQCVPSSSTIFVMKYEYESCKLCETKIFFLKMFFSNVYMITT